VIGLEVSDPAGVDQLQVAFVLRHARGHVGLYVVEHLIGGRLDHVDGPSQRARLVPAAQSPADPAARRHAEEEAVRSHSYRQWLPAVSPSTPGLRRTLAGADIVNSGEDPVTWPSRSIRLTQSCSHSRGRSRARNCAGVSLAFCSLLNCGAGGGGQVLAKIGIDAAAISARV